MKSVLFILDGVGDDPIPDLGGRTPLGAAFAPHLHYLASRGRIGRIRTTFPGLPIESMVCIMGLLGYPPGQYYPGGRSSFEAMAKGIPLHPRDLVLRCNTVSVDPVAKTMVDFTGGLISDADARALIARIELPHENWELYPGQSYRNLLIIRRAGVDTASVACSEPHMHPGEAFLPLLPTSRSPESRVLCEELSRFLLDSTTQIERMGLRSGVRANMLWVWSPSRKPVWPTFKSLTGLDSACVGGLDFLLGIAMAAGMRCDVIPGATGYLDTNYRAKAEYTIQFLRDADFVLTHINAPDEAAHQHDHRGKVEAIERIDQFVVGPVLRHLESTGEDYRVVVCGDHNTRCRDGRHTDDPVPFAAYSPRRSVTGGAFTEAACSAFPPIDSLQVLSELVLR